MGSGSFFNSLWQKLGDLWEPLGQLLEKTHLQEQIQDVDAAGLLSNPWFLVPFIALAGYMIYKKAFRDMIILGAVMAVWYASGTPYMQSLVVNGELQVNKVLPVLFGGAVVMGIVIYLLFGRSD